MEETTGYFLNKSAFFAAQRSWTPVPLEILRAKGLSMQAKMTYIDICSYIYRQEGFACWPKQSTIAGDFEVSRPSINQYLQELRNYGLITWIQRGFGKTNLYALLDFPLTNQGLAGPVQANLDMMEKIDAELAQIADNLYQYPDVNILTSSVNQLSPTVNTLTAVVNGLTSPDSPSSHVLLDPQAVFSGGEEKEYKNKNIRRKISDFSEKNQVPEEKSGKIEFETSTTHTNRAVGVGARKRLKGKNLEAFTLVADNLRKIKVSELERRCKNDSDRVLAAYHETVKHGVDHYNYFATVYDNIPQKISKIPSFAGAAKKFAGTKVDYDAVDPELYGGLSDE